MIYLLQHYTPNWKELIETSKPVHEEYCLLHGYKLVIKEVPEYEVYNGIEKLKMIGENLKEGDVALVMDADAMVTNLLLKVERFLENEKYLYLSDGVNCGIFVVRKTNWLSSFMQMCIKHIENGSYNCEQDRIEQYVKYHNDEHIKIVGHPCFNSFIPELYGHIENPEAITHEQGKWQNGDFICHLPALSMETRLQKMKELKEMIVR